MLPRVDFSKFYAPYAASGAPPYAPELLFGLLLYGYCTGVFSSRKIARATYDSLAFRYLAGGTHPDHDTIANFRRQFLEELKDMFVQVLLLAQEVGELKFGNVSLDGSKIPADASKSKAVSHKRLLELDIQLRQEVDELFKLAASAEAELLPEGFNPNEEMVMRQVRLARLSTHSTRSTRRRTIPGGLGRVSGQSARARNKARQTGRKPGGRPPQPPVAGPHDTDQYNFTDPESQIMKNSKDGGFDQHYNAQVAVKQETFLIVANTISNHANDKQEAVPTVDAIDPRLGTTAAGALDDGYSVRAEYHRPRESRYRSLYRYRTRASSQDLAGVFRAAALATSRNGERQRADGVPTPDRDRQENLRLAHMHSRTCDRHHQGDVGVSPVLLAWPEEGGRRMESGLLSLQCKTSVCFTGIRVANG